MKKLLAAVLLLSACASSTDGLTPEQVTLATDTWADKRWEGSWGGACTGYLETSTMKDGKITAEYGWGVCGDSAGGFLEGTVTVLPNNSIRVDLPFGTKATYKQISPTVIEGDYSSRRGGTGNGKFTLVGS